MQDTLLDKNDWLARIAQASDDWRSLAAAMGTNVDLPGTSGDWSFRTMTSHLNGWRRWTVERLEAASEGREPVCFWPDHLTEETPAEVDAINEWMIEQARDLTFADLLAEADDQYRRMAAAVEAIAEEELVIPGRLPWLGDDPLCAVIDGSNEHRAEHVEQVQAWLATRA